nr:hypothetical protein [Chloroflexota bacterium]
DDWALGLAIALAREGGARTTDAPDSALAELAAVAKACTLAAILRGFRRLEAIEQANDRPTSGPN